MDNKNSKSDSYIIRDAENIIKSYLRDRELSDIKSYYNLKEKYNRLKILTICILITFFVGMIINTFLK